MTEMRRVGWGGLRRKGKIRKNTHEWNCDYLSTSAQFECSWENMGRRTWVRNTFTSRSISQEVLEHSFLLPTVDGCVCSVQLPGVNVKQTSWMSARQNVSPGSKMRMQWSTDGPSFTSDGNYIAMMENKPLTVWWSGVLNITDWRHTVSFIYLERSHYFPSLWGYFLNR